MKECPFQLLGENGKPFFPPAYPLRDGLPPVPAEMEHLPRDHRGYPVPFFVSWIKNEPEFRCMSTEVRAHCVQYKLCWVCGRPLEGQQVFTIGPMCTINRVSGEPPAHRNCARFSARACPFLTKPHMVRREEGMPEGSRVSEAMLKRNPGVTALWFAQAFQVEMHDVGLLWHFTQKPVAVEWYKEGRVATRDEVIDAIEAGLPQLREMSKVDNSEAELELAIVRARPLVPRR